MATHRKKVVEVAAWKWEGPGTMAVYHKVKGDQSAKKGDWLVGPDNPDRGDIEVVKDEDFQRDYEPIDAVTEPTPEPAEETPLLHETTAPGGETQDGVPVAQPLEPETLEAPVAEPEAVEPVKE